MNERVLQVEDLHVHFPLEHGRVVKAVRGVSFHIDRGETLAIVGESGSGKSVTAMSVMRLNDFLHAKYPSGKITLTPQGHDPIDVLGQSQRRMQEVRGDHVSMIFQEPMTSLNPVFTIGNQIARVDRAATRRSEARSQARDAVPWTMLRQGRHPRRPRKRLDASTRTSFSGGMRQRVMIAMALACRPVTAAGRRADDGAGRDDPGADHGADRQMLQDRVRHMSMISGDITHDMGVVAESLLIALPS